MILESFDDSEKVFVTFWREEGLLLIGGGCSEVLRVVLDEAEIVVLLFSVELCDFSSLLRIV